MVLKFLFIFILSNSELLYAGSTSFPGAVGIQGRNAEYMNYNQLNYSFKYWFAVGAHYLKLDQGQEGKQWAGIGSLNFLLKRWNGESYQANLYTSLGAGHTEINNHNDTVGFGNLQFDIESRKYYFLLKHTGLYTDKITNWAASTVRLGLAPYIEGSNKLHAWFILEGKKVYKQNHSQFYDLTPFIRLFYKNLLFELGYSYNYGMKFNYTIHL